MQSTKINVKNVTVYAYFDPKMPLTEVISEGGTGVYSIGTLFTSQFYNLNLADEGTKKNPLTVHSKYYAVGETESGDHFSTPWMFCTSNADEPAFGRTIKGELQHVDFPEVPVANNDQYITLGPLTDITVSQLFTPPAIGQRLLIQNGTGNIIATKIGTPHEMGVQVNTGDVEGHMVEGMKNVIITGKTHDGHLFTQTGCSVVSAGKPAIFIKKFMA